MEEENGEVCDTELCLSPIGHRRSSRRGKATELKQADDGNITIFYDGRICICDVTEIQARAIISMAKEMEMAINNNENKSSDDTLERLQVPYGSNTPASSMAMVPSQLLNQSPSMKRSLQRFLQKRKTRRSLRISSLPDL